MAAILEPGYSAGISPGGGGDVHVTVIVQIAGDGFEGVFEAWTDDVLLPVSLGVETVVFVPDDLVVFGFQRGVNLANTTAETFVQGVSNSDTNSYPNPYSGG